MNYTGAKKAPGEYAAAHPGTFCYFDGSQPRGFARTSRECAGALLEAVYGHFGAEMARIDIYDSDEAGFTIDVRMKYYDEVKLEAALADDPKWDPETEGG